MHELLFLLKNHAPEITFLAVFIEQIGLPIPAMPVLIVAGAFEPSGDGLFVLISVAVVAALLADILWYFAGKRWGFKILRSLCNISLSSDSCVRQTEGIFSRFGHIALLLSKFIPGFSTVAPPLAGATGIAWAPFVLFDGLGSVTWVVLMMAIGRVFKDGIQAILVKMTKIGSWSGI
ncbi:MAG: DedA family protein, partial [Pseudomonadota bacterium]|nr:DedA family protein [Pseudomonadota bacterium]